MLACRPPVGNEMKLTDRLNFPTSVAIAPGGAVYVAESGLAFDEAPAGGVIYRVHSDGSRSELARNLRPPVNGITWHDESLIVSEGGHPGRIRRLCLRTGEMRLILDGLPGLGNYHTNKAVVGPDGKLYFSQGALTNSSVIGLDSLDLAWLRTVPHECDIPGYDITLTGWNAETRDPRRETPGSVRTGSFALFGEEAHPGQHIAGRVPCTAGVMRCNLDGSALELVAWGLRNAYGLGFLRDGRLLATDQGADARGSRPVWNCPDFLYEVRPGAWYGWPDFFGAQPITAGRFAGPDGTRQEFVLANHAELPPPENPLVEFEVNACAVRFVELREPAEVSLLVALFGDERPLTGPAGRPVGRALVRVSLKDWTVHPTQPFPFQRPIDVALDASGNLYVVDFGHFEITADKGIAARAGSGCIWKFPPGFLGAGFHDTVSFETDIMPVFRQFRGSMLWRFDLTNYDHVKANAAKIYEYIQTKQMPPPPYPPLTGDQVSSFKRWMESGYRR